MTSKGYGPRTPNKKPGRLSKGFRQYILDAGFTVSTLSKKFGMHVTTLDGWVDGLNRPQNKDLILRLAKTVGCPEDKIYE